MSNIDTNTIDTAADATIAKVSPFKFTPLNVVMQWVKVGLIVAALHYFIHQSFTTDAMEFVLGGAFMTGFFMLMCKPHLVDKIPNQTWSNHDEMVSDWKCRSNPAYSYEIDNVWNSDQDWESSNNAYDYSYLNTLDHDSTDYVSHHFGCDTISHISSE